MTNPFKNKKLPKISKSAPKALKPLTKEELCFWLVFTSLLLGNLLLVFSL